MNCDLWSLHVLWLCILGLTDMGKYSVGRLRPHFIDGCKPEGPGLNLDVCKIGEYITNFTCTTTNKKVFADLRLSFPSGHASMSAMAMIFLAVSVLLTIELVYTYMYDQACLQSRKLLCVIKSVYQSVVSPVFHGCQKACFIMRHVPLSNSSLSGLVDRYTYEEFEHHNNRQNNLWYTNDIITPLMRSLANLYMRHTV